MLLSASNEPASKSEVLRLLVDENVAPRVTAYLRQQADVRDVKEEGWFGWTDEALLGLAQREGRIVVTYDVNFAGLKRLRQDHHGIIFIRLQNMRADSVVAALQTFVAEHGYRNLSNTLATIQETRTRFRRTR